MSGAIPSPREAALPFQEHKYTGQEITAVGAETCQRRCGGALDTRRLQDDAIVDEADELARSVQEGPLTAQEVEDALGQLLVLAVLNELTELQ